MAWLSIIIRRVGSKSVIPVVVLGLRLAPSLGVRVVRVIIVFSSATTANDDDKADHKRAA